MKTKYPMKMNNIIDKTKKREKKKMIFCKSVVVVYLFVPIRRCMKRIAILGSTGSIGESTLKIVRHLGPGQIKVVAIAAHTNIEALEKQALEFRPEVIAVFDKTKASLLKKKLPGMNILGGIEGVEAAASYSEANFVVSALRG